MPTERMVNEAGSGTAVLENRMLSAAKENPLAMNVNCASVKGVVLRTPAKPPGSVGSGLALKEREPKEVVPSNSVMVVAFAPTGLPDAIA
jgi:hypothetical protein